MRFGRLVLVLSIIAGVATAASPSFAAQTAAALTGKVTGPDGKPMEGVVVTAGNPNSTITVSVVSAADGTYRFPASKLAPGRYFLAIRATGYDLDGDGAAKVAAGHPATVDLKLKPTHDLASQMTNADWLASFPGSDQQKLALLSCTGCHTLQRIARATHDETEWLATIKRMATYAQESSPLKPQKTEDSFLGRTPPEVLQHLAAYLASVDLSQGPAWKYPLKVMPRVNGAGTHVVVTEYKLPDPVFEPHDVILDNKGQVWFSDFVQLELGHLDPKTGKVTEYPLPQRKANAPVGELDIEQDGPHDLVMGMTWQATLARFDTNTKKFNFYPIPKAADDSKAQLIMTTNRADVDGHVWTANEGHHEFYRVNLKSGAFQKFGPFPHTSYGLAADSHDNLFFADFGNDTIGRIDAKTGQATFYQTPTKMSRPRRGHMDAQDRFWFAEFNANAVGMLDTKTGTIKEWQVPTPWTAPYDAIVDKDGKVWTGGMTTDRVVRLDPQTGQAVEYPLPDDTNIRRVFVDNRTTPPTLWTGSNHGAAIVKVEPLD
ncbi:MAG TPA: carboxypeptidase regulatory-like domain-containing protein [Stellaceae bacterium]|nr:carboxypeptidase regulatory-like domain-containing protein [Stellaceae bacterium]